MQVVHVTSAHTWLPGRARPLGDPTRRTIVSFHAHPDDESLLTAGTLAALAAAGHRTVLVTATAGEQGLADRRMGSGAELAALRARSRRCRRRARLCAPRDPRLSGLGDRRDGVRARRLRAPRGRAGRPATRRGAAAGERRRPDRLRPGRRVRAPGPPPGAPGGRTGGASRRHPAGARGDRRPARPAGGDALAPVAARDVRRRPSGRAEANRITFRVDVRLFAAAKRAAIGSHRSSSPAGARCACCSPCPTRSSAPSWATSGSSDAVRAVRRSSTSCWWGSRRRPPPSHAPWSRGQCGE